MASKLVGWLVDCLTQHTNTAVLLKPIFSDLQGGTHTHRGRLTQACGTHDLLVYICSTSLNLWYATHSVANQSIAMNFTGRKWLRFISRRASPWRWQRAELLLPPLITLLSSVPFKPRLVQSRHTKSKEHNTAQNFRKKPSSSRDMLLNTLCRMCPN